MSDRLAAALEDVVTLLLPKLQAGLAFCIQWEMRVLTATPAVPVVPVTVPPAPNVFATPAMVSCAPVAPVAIATIGAEVNIPIWADAGGCVSVPTIGSLVRVGFANADPSKPFIAAIDPQTMPTVSVVQALRAFCSLPAPLTPLNLSANAATLLTALGLVG